MNDNPVNRMGVVTVLAGKKLIDGEEVMVPIQSSGARLCISCGRPITPENDSGWERFTPDGVTTQPVGKGCPQ